MLAIREGMPLDEFMALQDIAPFELIDGERIEKMPAAYRQAWIIRTINTQLTLQGGENPPYYVFGEATFILPDVELPRWVKGSRIPDVMVYERERFVIWQQTFKEEDVAISLVPDWVVEVVSPTDLFSEVNKKAKLYLQDGVRLVWVIDPKEPACYVYTPDSNTIQTLGADAILDASPVVPDFRISMRKLLE